MRHVLAASLPPIVIVAAFFLPMGGSAPWARSGMIILAFGGAGVLGVRAEEPRPARQGALLALPDLVVGSLLTLLGAMEPAHLLYGSGMASAALATTIGAAWSIAATRRQFG